MGTKNLKLELAQIFRDIFNLESDCSPEEMLQEKISDWDSIGHIRLISTIESEFDMKFNLEEAIKIVDFDGFLRYLEKSGT